MQLNLPPDTEAILRQQALALGLSLEEFAAQKLDELVEKPQATPKDHRAWLERVRAWSESHPEVKHFVDDSRERIYEGRGE